MSKAHPAFESRWRPAALSARPAGTPVLRRHRTGRIIGGVAGGVAEHLGVNVLWVRVTFAVLAGFAGAGLAAYALLWVFVPQESLSAEHGTSQKERQQASALIALGVSLAVAVGTLSGVVSTWIAVSAGAALVGSAVVWREADEAQRRRWVDGARTGVSGVVTGGGRSGLVRVLTGVLMVIIGIGVFLLQSLHLPGLRFTLAAVLATLVGVGVLTLPWWLRLVRDLGDERRARIRTEERAEIAAHLHDSVLQTLALIQKQPQASREVLRLARGQERELRNWLYGPSGYGGPVGDEDRPSVTLSQAIALVCGEVEDTFAIAVRPVVVGDCPMDGNLAALAQSAREAMINAAKHSGEAEVSVYAEVEAQRATVFVRDRGKGFDPDAVPADRHGLADSIRGRMERHGGTVKLRTAVGEGTEVQLGMPRTTNGSGSRDGN